MQTVQNDVYVSQFVLGRTVEY